MNLPKIQESDPQITQISQIRTQWRCESKASRRELSWNRPTFRAPVRRGAQIVSTLRTPALLLSIPLPPVSQVPERARRQRQNQQPVRQHEDQKPPLHVMGNEFKPKSPQVNFSLPGRPGARVLK